ncbi:MAG TPA: tRNA (N6-isopentenyl adenosine(37)-C2)-methylthiotransferase MiaB [Proteobacteria bacterium]|nr:tRNA (N6-isopentenyl adenosine(37)-C2)-methylthiotransferase MiaB [Pseudomonadota bacterium]
MVDSTKIDGATGNRRDMRKAYIRTFGCQMNVYDSDGLAARLASAGWEMTSDPREAELWIVNSCSVRAKSEHKAISELGRLASIKARKGKGVLALVGCVAQQHADAILERQPACDLVVGTRAYGRFLELVERAMAGERIADVGDEGEGGIESLHPKSNICPNGVVAFVPVMRGCNNFCSYCIVPYVRGPEVSRAPADVIREVEALVARGVREVTLLGQNVNSYGRGTDYGDFADLLQRVSEVDGLVRIRFTTSHPKDFTDRLCEVMAENPKVCKHLHLPFQSGSNRILELMNRGYTREEYIEKVARARERIGELAVSADVMVGFCTETEDDFIQTLDLIETVGFDGLFTFRYTPRPFSKAYNWADGLPYREKIRRLQAVQDLQNRIQLERNRELVGKEVRVLVERRDKKRANWMTGRTEQNRVVHFYSAGADAGNVVRVKIERAFTHHLEGVEAHEGERKEEVVSSNVQG